MFLSVNYFLLIKFCRKKDKSYKKTKSKSSAANSGLNKAVSFDPSNQIPSNSKSSTSEKTKSKVTIGGVTVGSVSSLAKKVINYLY